MELERAIKISNKYGLHARASTRLAQLAQQFQCDVYLAREGRHKPHHKTQNPYSHLTLLARNEEGYRNLLKLATTSYLEGFHYRPRVDKPFLAAHAEGVIALSACNSGEIPRHILSGGKQDLQFLFFLP